MLFSANKSITNKQNVFEWFTFKNVIKLEGKTDYRARFCFFVSILLSFLTVANAVVAGGGGGGGGNGGRRGGAVTVVV